MVTEMSKKLFDLAVVECCEGDGQVVGERHTTRGKKSKGRLVDEAVALESRRKKRKQKKKKKLLLVVVAVHAFGFARSFPPLSSYAAVRRA